MCITKMIQTCEKYEEALMNRHMEFFEFLGSDGVLVAKMIAHNSTPLFTCVVIGSLFTEFCADKQLKKHFA